MFSSPTDLIFNRGMIADPAAFATFSSGSPIIG